MTTNIKEKVSRKLRKIAIGNEMIFVSKAIDLTLAEVGKVIGEEKKLVNEMCLGLVHPSQDNQEEFTKWLQDTVNFHINQVKQKLRIK